MRIKRSPQFKIEAVYREVPDKKDRVRQLWDLLISLPEPEDKKSENNNKHHYENQKIATNV